MYCDGSLDEEGEYTVEALMLSRGQGESRKTFSRLRPGVLFPSDIMSTFFHSLRVWHAIFLLWNFAFSFYQPGIPICLTILHTFFNTASYLFHIYPVS